jgi:hypothetical protein
VLNLETNQIVETCKVTFDETQPRSQLIFECVGDDELGEEIFQEEHEHGDDEDGGVVPPAEHAPTTSATVVDGPSPTPTTTNQDQGEAVVEGEVASRREPPRRVQVDHPASRIIGDMNERTTRSRVRNNSHFGHVALVATFEPKDTGHALSDHNWVNLMHEELENFERNQVWDLVALAARLEAIRILLAFSMAKGFKLHEMDVKSAFLNGVLEEEVYVRQPPRFESEKYPHRVYKLRKALYRLKQAPRAWYGRLKGFLFERGFEM